jgi:hypothetical protein
VINFVFEDIDNLQNFTQCPDINKSGIRRFAPAVIASALTRRIKYAGNSRVYKNTDELPNKVIIASGVNHHPDDWAIGKQSGTSVLDNISPQYLKLLQQGQALLVLDQSLEGYQTEWLWQFFHEDCSKHGVNPRAVVYVTGNMIADEQYTNWANDHKVCDTMKVIPYMHFERDIQQIAKRVNLVSNFDTNLEYKKSNPIKTYNCLQKRQRVHRSWFYLYLYKNNLLDAGLVSTNSYGNHIPNIDGIKPPQQLLEEAGKLLPLVVHGEPNNVKDDQHYINRILDKVCLDSWVSVVSEASFVDSENTLFLSEKIFKPIACMHPFIILGNKGSLKKLKEMGYKTFEGFIDERYDELDTFPRFEAIIHAIKQIDAIEDKVEWYKSMRHILEHNYRVFCASEHKDVVAHTSLINYYNEYFKEQ